MDYKQLQFFLAVCEAQSFRNAAARCYVSQQAISKSLSNLEQELGVQLSDVKLLLGVKAAHLP